MSDIFVEYRQEGMILKDCKHLRCAVYDLTLEALCAGQILREARESKNVYRRDFQPSTNTSACQGPRF